MNEQQIELTRLEQNIMSTRQELLKLSDEYMSINNNPDTRGDRLITAYYKDKINYLETETVHLQNQARILRDIILSDERARYPQQYVQQPIQQPIQQQQLMNDTGVNLIPVSEYSQRDMREQPKERNYERFFGRNFMGIFASILIFISIGLFAVLVLPQLSDIIKIIVMYTASFAILASGIFLEKKNKDNSFYLVLLSLGTGALYISLLMSNVYFKVLGDIPLYLFIIVWAILMRYLTKYKTMLFQIIGYIGLWVSSGLGIMMCVADNNPFMYLMVVIFYILCSFIFADMDRVILKIYKPSEKTEQIHLTYKSRLISHISKPLIVIMFLIGFIYINEGWYRLIAIGILAVHLILDYCFAYVEESDLDIVFSIVSVIDLLLLIGLFHQTYLTDNQFVCVFAVAVAYAMLLTIDAKEMDIKAVLQIPCFIIIGLFCLLDDFMRTHMYAYITVIPAVVHSKLLGGKIYKIAALGHTLCLSIIVFASYRTVGFEQLFIISVVSIVLLVMAFEEDSLFVRIASYIILLLSIAVFIDGVLFELIRDIPNIDYPRTWAGVVTFYVVSVIHIIMTYIKFFGDEDRMFYAIYAVNGILMGVGCTLMQDEPFQVVTVIITLILFMINTKRIMEINDNAGYYIALKYTAFTTSVLAAMNATTYVISIVLLLFSIGSICFGFYKSLKPFRLYGLILSLISVLKLLLIDIHYDSLAQNALGFFIGGILCLVISFIYHKIDTGFKNK